MESNFLVSLISLKEIDHGTAAPHLFLWGRVKGEFYGRQPNLHQIENENLMYDVHFRQLYATVAKEWRGLTAPFLLENLLWILR